MFENRYSAADVAIDSMPEQVPEGWYNHIFFSQFILAFLAMVNSITVTSQGAEF